MTRIAPYLTLGAVALLGGGLLIANYTGSSTAAPTAPVPIVAAATGPEGAPVPAPLAGAPAPADAVVDGGVDDVGGGYGGVPGGGQDAPPAAPSAVYAGWTADREMTVAVAVTGGDAVAWICGDGIEVWLRGTVDDNGAVELVSESGRTTMTGIGADADLAGSVLSGSIVSDGEEYFYTADPVDVAEAVADGRDDVADVAERAGLAG